MEKQGTVAKVAGDMMTVAIVRDSACGDNCAACGLCGNRREMTVELKNDGGFAAGDKVLLVSEDSKVVGNSAIGYLSLTALLVGGGVAGAYIGGDWAAFCGAIIGLGLGIGLLRLVFKNKMDIEIYKVED